MTETELAVGPERVRRIDQIGHESRQKILDAAEALFAEKGFHRTSFVEVAERSGISRGSIPWHFNNKEGLLLAVVKRMISRHFRSSVKHTDLAKQTIEQIVADFAHFVQQPNGEVLLLIVTEALSSTGAAHEQYVDYLRERRDAWAVWIAAQPAFAASSVKDREAAAVVLHGATIGIQMQWQIDPETVDLERTLAWFTRMCGWLLASAAAKPAPKKRL